MNVIVCMKQVPDTETLIKIKPDGSGIVTDDIKYVMNVYCEFAVEEALRIKEKFGGQAILVTMGGPGPWKRCAPVWPWGRTGRSI